MSHDVWIIFVQVPTDLLAHARCPKKSEIWYVHLSESEFAG